MSFIRKKKTPYGRIAAYEVTAIWDKEKKQSRSTSKYLGLLDERGEIISKGTVKVGRKKKVADVDMESAVNYAPLIEQSVLDFGNSYLVYEFIKKTKVYKHLFPILEKIPSLISLLTYRICQPGPMYNADLWYQGSIISFLEKYVKSESIKSQYSAKNESSYSLSSQNISRYMAYLGQEDVQRNFFKSYLTSENKDNTKRSIVIDSTSTPNEIRSEFNAYGYADGSITKQFRTHFVIDRITKDPLFFRNVPGNVPDISTLQITLEQMEQLGLKNSFVLLDAGFTSEENIKDIQSRNIDFLTRLPKGRKLYKNMIKTHASSLENLENIIKFGNRTLFVKTIETEDLYGQKGYVHMVLDPDKKAKDIKNIMEKVYEGKSKSISISIDKNETNEETEEEKIKRQKEEAKLEEERDFAFKDSGIFILISSQKIQANDVLSTYYTRQSIERLFGFAKDDLDLLPIRCHNDTTINGYFFLQFILLSIYIELRSKIKLKSNQTVEQALLSLRSIKAKIYEQKEHQDKNEQHVKIKTQALILESTKAQKEIFESCSVIVPKLIVGE